MNGKQLKNSILQWAIQGKLVPPVCRQAGKTLMTNPVPREKGKECWFTYVIECEDGSFYKGFTDNLLRRYQQHCNGSGADYTKTHKPKQLYYWEMHYSKEAALQREKYLKSGVGREWFKKEVVDKPENFEPASVLLEKIRQEKERLIKEKKIKRDKNASIIYRGEDNSYYEKMLATGEVKCIDEEVPFEIPQGWEWCRLGEISTYAQTKRKINASNADSQLWGLDLEDIEKGGRLLNIKTVGERKAIGDKTIFNRGDILYSKLRPYLLKILVAPEGGICTPEIIPFTCYGNICKDYIVSFLKSPYVDDYINSVTFGVKMPRVSTETMTSLLVPLPPLAEQFRIDTKTKELMPYIDGYGKAQNKLNKLNEELSNTIRKSILQEAIQGKLVPQIGEEGTAKELLEQIKAEKRKLVKEGKLKKSALSDSVIFRGDDNRYCEQIGKKCLDITEEIPFDIPSNWSWVRFGSVMINRDRERIPLSVAQRQNLSKEYDYYGASGVIDKVDRYLFDKELLLIGEDGANLLSRSTPIAFIAKGKYWVNNHAHVLDVYDGVMLKYIALYINSISLAPYVTGTAQPKMNQEKMNSILIALPPQKEQQRIVAQIEKLFEQLH